jgi:hypothetical protein
MTIPGFLIGLAFFCYFFFGRVCSYVFFFSALVFWVAVSFWRVQSGNCDKVWALDQTVPVNMFCEVKNELPKKSK